MCNRWRADRSCNRRGAWALCVHDWGRVGGGRDPWARDVRGGTPGPVTSTKDVGTSGSCVRITAPGAIGGIGSVEVVLRQEPVELLVLRELLTVPADGSAHGMLPSRWNAGLHWSNALALEGRLLVRSAKQHRAYSGSVNGLGLGFEAPFDKPSCTLFLSQEGAGLSLLLLLMSESLGSVSDWLAHV